MKKDSDSTVSQEAIEISIVSEEFTVGEMSIESSINEDGERVFAIHLTPTSEENSIMLEDYLFNVEVPMSNEDGAEGSSCSKEGMSFVLRTKEPILFLQNLRAHADISEEMKNEFTSKLSAFIAAMNSEAKFFGSSLKQVFTQNTRSLKK